MFRQLSTTLLLVLILISCAKERETQYVQSFPTDAIRKEEVHGVEFTLHTGAGIDGDSITSDATNIEVESNDIGFNDLRRVSYTTNAPFFKEVPFIGRPNTTYKLRYEVSDNKLVIYKVGPAENFPFNERIVADKINENEIKAPILSYDVTNYMEERVLNENNEETHQIRAQLVKSAEMATHVLVNESSRENHSLNTNNIFPADLLDGQWFFAATVVSASPEQATSIGRDVSLDFKARSVSRIKFEKYKDSIVGQNLNIDENLDVSDDINLKEAIAIPAKYFDIKKEAFNNVIKSPVARIDDEDYRLFSKDYKDRPYMELDFTQVLSAMTRATQQRVCDEGVVEDEGKRKPITICRTVTKPGLDLTRATLDSLEVANDYLAFVVYHKAEKVKIRYSLRKAHTPKKGKTYFEDDRKTYGFFGSTKYAILNHRYERKEAKEKLTFINRFYPDNGKIVYYFSKRTPEHMKEAGREAIRVWDEAFQKAETGIRVVLDESKTVHLGDIRYNIINIVDTKDGARLLGYGPSIVDSESGEIISATSNIYANPFRESWINTLRNYIRSEIGMFNVNLIGVPSPEKMTFYTDILNESVNNELNLVEAYNNQGENKDALSLLKSFGINTNSNTEELFRIKEAVTKNVNITKEKYSQAEGMFHFNAFDRTNKDSIEEIKAICGDSITNYIEELKASQLTHTDEELIILNNCADKLLQKSVIGTLVHELGHNFGLRHNFIASTDEENFIRDEEGHILAKTSSTMDYQPSNVKEIMKPGPYDIAAIRFGYANKVLLKNGETKTISTKESLSKQAQEKSLQTVSFKFCTDQDVQRLDPLCQRHDDGKTPLEIVKNTIDGFYASYAVYGNRYDRAKGPNSDTFALNHLSRTFIPLKLIFNQWRHHLNAFLSGNAEENAKTGQSRRRNESDTNNYLDSLDKEGMREVLERMKNSTGKFSRLYNEYYKASELAYNFLKEIIFTPALVCAGKSSDRTPDENVVLIDFEEVKQGVFSNTNTTIDSCDHVLAINYLEGLGLEYVGNFGRYHDEQKESLDIRDINYQLINSVGFEKVRRMALAALTMRTPIMAHSKENGFVPNFLDNPVYREEILDMTFKRILVGLDASPFGLQNDGHYGKTVFVREKDFLLALGRAVVRAINIPENATKSAERIDFYRPNRTTNPTIPDRENDIITRFQHFYIHTKNEPIGNKTVGQLLIEKRLELLDLVKDLEMGTSTPENLAVKTSLTLQTERVLIGLDEVQQIKVNKFSAYLNKMLELAKDYETIDKDVAYVTDIHVNKELSKFIAAGNKALQQAEDGATVRNMTMGEFVRAYSENYSMEDLKLVARDTFHEAVEPVVTDLIKRRQESEKALPFKGEIEAHLDLLTQILMTI